MNNKIGAVLLIVFCIMLAIILGGISHDKNEDKTQLKNKEETQLATPTENTVAVSPDAKEFVHISTNLTFELPTNVTHFTDVQKKELSDFLYEKGWDTVSAYYAGIYGEKPRNVLSSIELEPVQTETVTSTGWDEELDENGDSIIKTYETHTFKTTISYLLHSTKSNIKTSRLTIVFSAPINGETAAPNAITQTTISNTNSAIDTSYYTLVETWQGVTKLYKCNIDNGFQSLSDEYYDVQSNRWGSDQEDSEQRDQAQKEDQKKYWPPSANSSWDNLLNIGAQFKCDANTDTWYALVGDRICYWIPTEKEWLTDYEVLFETYYLTSKNGIDYKLYEMINGERIWQLGFDRTLTADGSLVVE